jgi:sulfate adenylyltransferase subunit 2
LNNLTKLENKSIFIIREAYAQFKNMGVLWSMGKDSTVLLWIIKKVFLEKIPFPVIHIDTGFKFPEMYKFRDRLVKKWKINLAIAKNENAIKQKVNPIKNDRFFCCTKLKTEALRDYVERHKLDALLLAIRRDEHNIRAKERYFSPRDKNFKWGYKKQSPEFWNFYKAFFKKNVHHHRVHPLLHWTESDVWQYIKQEKIPVNPLYFSKKGQRFRSLGCMPCTVPFVSDATNINKIIKELKHTSSSERGGRAQDKEKEYMMQRLRSLGYM